MTSADLILYSVAEYFEHEAASQTRYEYLDGEIVPVAGASRVHNLLVMNCSASLHAQLRQRQCVVYAMDMRVRVSQTRYIYPDVAVVCGTQELDATPLDTLVNPTVTIEVLSASTEEDDLTAKARMFRAMPSIQEYVFISQHEVYIEHYRRNQGGWFLQEYNRLEDTLILNSIDCSLSLSDIYEKTPLKQDR